MSKINCQTEYDPLLEVILCEPTHMRIEEAINLTQAYYKEANINREIAVRQHQTFVNSLRSHQIRVQLLPAHPTFQEQVFTRDIGFTIENTLYVASLKREIRQGEQLVLKEELQKMNLSYQECLGGTIEGGDVILGEHCLYVGESSRTSRGSVSQLQNAYPKRCIEMIAFDDEYLHLDCVFNPISADTALIYREAIEEESVKLLEQQYKLIDVTKEEQFTLATNVLSIGYNKVFCLPQNVQANTKLREAGYTTIEVDLSEIIKSGGSFRCITLPVRRKK
ncbi:hypothetical protein GN156_02925 [bacterium LRH843]|nr:hypothetical protein [bacterium LRH843]